MFFSNLLGGPFQNAINSVSFDGSYSFLKSIATFLDGLIVPLTLIIGVAGGIWVLVLGVNLARAETADKAQEAKKRLINVAVAMIAVIMFIWLLTWFITNADKMFGANPIK